LQFADRISNLNPDSGIFYANKALRFFNLIVDSKSITDKQKELLKANAFFILGSIHLKNGVTDSSVLYCIDAVNLYSKHKEDKKLAESLIILGTVYDYQAKNKEALVIYSKAHKLFEKLNDTNGVARTLNNLGIMYYSQGDTVTGVEFLERCLVINQQIGNYEEVIWNVNNLGNIYMKMNNYPKALKMFKKALSIDDKVENKGGLAYTLKSIGNYYIAMGMPDSALYYHKKDLELYTKLKGESGIALSNTNIGRAYLLKGNYQLAKQYGETAYEITKNLNLAIRSHEVSELLKDVYPKTGEYKKALYFTNIWMQLKDSMHNINSERAALHQRMEYEYNQKEALANEKHTQELRISNEREQKQKILTIAIAGGLGLVVMFLIFVFNRLRVTKKQKLVIEEQKQEVEKQKEVIEESHKEITDSITYAKRIQSAILPPDKVVKEYLQESFILYKPKDIVAGDFYWLESVAPTGNKKEQLILFAAADCTGHGVPGAMVSVVCNNALNRSVREHGLTEPGLILNKTRALIIDEFEKSDEDVKDGMDIALCSLEGNTLKYAGAHNPLWIIRGGEIQETKANKQPIGKFDNQLPYTTHTFDLQKGDSIYIFSDGYVDQFGGEKGKKFKAKAFRELLLSIQGKAMEEQKDIIDNSFESWRGNLEQIDDVCVIGVSV